MDVAHAIVKVYVTERNDIIKPHSNVITIWRSSAIEVTALLKKLRSEMKGVQEKTRGRGWGGGCNGNDFDFGMGVRASTSKPTLVIYLAFEKTDPFIY